jgi:hypothetical protein
MLDVSIVPEWYIRIDLCVCHLIDHVVILLGDASLVGSIVDV